MENIPIIHNQEDAKAHDPSKPALVEVPGELVRMVVWMLESFQKTSNDEPGKVLKTLLKNHQEKYT